MALMSPRFKDDPVLQKAAMNAPPLRKGARGHAVHLIQMALLDLGNSMPRSTGREYSPDGIFGDETHAVTRKFQRENGLTDDGVIGARTMAALDRKLPRHTHRVSLHFRSLALTTVPFPTVLAATERAFGQYGIRVDMANGQSLALSKEEAKRFDKITQSCEWDLNDGDFHALHSLGTPAPHTDILVYFIGALADGDLGCGGHATNRPATTIAARANRWDTAHEICHVLLGSSFEPVHSPDLRNLMHATAPHHNNVPALTEKQLARMRASVCCHRI